MEEVSLSVPNSNLLLSAGLGRLSLWPDEPIRAWALNGCQFYRLECWQYGDTGHTVFDYGPLSHEDSSKWFWDPPRKINNEQPSAGLKILIIDGVADIYDASQATVDVSRESAVVDEAIAAFQMSPATLPLLSLGANAPSCSDLLRVSGAQKGQPRTMFLEFPYQSVVWTWDLTTLQTCAIYRSDLPLWSLTDHLAYWIREYETLTDIPLLLPYLATYIAVTQQSRMLTDNMQELRTIEAQSGFQTWNKNVSVELAAATELAALSAKASGTAAAACARKTDCGFIDRALRSIQQEITFLSKMTAHIDNAASFPAKIRQFEECLAVLGGMVTSQTSFAEEIKERATIQQSALFHSVAQRDQELSLKVAHNSRTIALESRRDSLSMKTIAFMTMIFLPGAFVATLFAMPIFNWTSDEYDDVVNRRFWVYWAVTVPLTLSVLGGWRIWFVVQSRRAKLEAVEMV